MGQRIDTEIQTPVPGAVYVDVHGDVFEVSGVEAKTGNVDLQYFDGREIVCEREMWPLLVTVRCDREAANDDFFNDDAEQGLFDDLDEDFDFDVAGIGVDGEYDVDGPESYAG